MRPARLALDKSTDRTNGAIFLLPENRLVTHMRFASSSKTSQRQKLSISNRNSMINYIEYRV